MGFDFAGTDKLLGIDEICSALSISRSAFERMRKKPLTTVKFGKQTIVIKQQEENDIEGMPPFPPPTLMLGKSPRWSATDLNEWINHPRSS